MNPEPPKQKGNSVTGIVIAALRGGSGKTIFSVGTIAALCRKGVSIAPFKKGPDYIDAGWLAMAAGRPCYNLDTFLVSPESIIQSYQNHSSDAELAIIEGNRGLYDCIDTSGETSTAELAKMLDLPMIICIDGTKTTRTMAAVVSGCMAFDPDLKLKGVVLNRVAGSRHERILRDSIEYYCGIPVVGALPKQRTQRFPERHMGLVPTAEHEWAHEAVTYLADLAQKHIDLDAIQALSQGQYQWKRKDNLDQLCSDHSIAVSPPSRQNENNRSGFTTSSQNRVPEGHSVSQNKKRISKPCIGIIRDSAFQFYYPENLEALEMAGAELLFTSPLNDPDLPVVDGLYIGGGFPETHARQLSENRTYADRLKALAEDGLPIYAECGGLMYMGEKLMLPEGDFPMTGVLQITFGFSKRPQGHGYTIVRVDLENPYFAVGSTIRGHEFHYSTVENVASSGHKMVFTMKRGNGIQKGCDGLCYKNVLATYTHIHALGTPQWAPALVRQAEKYKNKIKNISNSD